MQILFCKNCFCILKHLLLNGWIKKTQKPAPIGFAWHEVFAVWALVRLWRAFSPKLAKGAFGRAIGFAPAKNA
jgi:hypothetical protein